MKKIAVLGSGLVTKPAVDYFLDTCGYEITLTSLNKAEAQKIIGSRPKAKAVAWTIDQLDLLDKRRSNEKNSDTWCRTGGQAGS